jgi:hypothetical protein
MKRLLIIPLLCALALGQGIGGKAGIGGTAGLGVASGGGTFTLVQHVLGAACTGGTNACSITVSATGTGHVGILNATDVNGASLTILSVSGGGTWTAPAGCVLNSASVGTTMCAYNTNLSSGATTITVTWSSTSTSANDKLAYYEYSYSGSSVSFDNAGTVSRTATLTPTGVTPSLTGSNDVIVQGIAMANGVVSSQTVYGNGLYATNFQGTADLENTTSTTPPVWTSGTSAVSLGFYIALKGN